MKKSEVPQNKGPLENISKEVVYAKNEDGVFVKTLSSGWDVKHQALDNAWDDLTEKMEEAKALVLDKKKSPIYYFMLKNLMDIKVLASYVGISRFSVKRHMKYDAFLKLDEDVLKKYASIFELTVEDLKKFGEE